MNLAVSAFLGGGQHTGLQDPSSPRSGAADRQGVLSQLSSLALNVFVFQFVLLIFLI